MKAGLFFSPTQFPTSRQWWSKVATQRLHFLQCFVRSGYARVRDKFCGQDEKNEPERSGRPCRNFWRPPAAFASLLRRPSSGLTGLSSPPAAGPGEALPALFRLLSIQQIYIHILVTLSSRFPAAKPKEEAGAQRGMQAAEGEPAP